MSITGPSGPLVSLDRHTGTGRITKVTTGSLEETRSYDPTFGELSSIDVVRAGMPLYSVGYLRDALGRVTTKTESIGAAAATTTTFGYDAAGRLETETVNGGTPATWTFQPNGARTTDVDAQDRVHEYGGVTFTYTAAGERETSTDAAGETAYTWDRLGNLLTVDGPAHDPIEYVYDALNRRIGKKLAGVTTSWLYDGQLRIVAELTDGIVTKQFHYASRSNVPDVMLTIDGNGAISATYRLVTDQLGSVRMVANATTGATAQQIDYDSWGNATVTLGAASFQPFGFAGGLYDPDTKLVHFGARDYDPKLGAWISKDPARFGGGWNFYEYASNDPVNLIDPTGRVPSSPEGAIADYIGGLIGAAFDFIRNYHDMREANTIGGDKYFHCLANCQASSTPEGELGAHTISAGREFTDEHVKGDPPLACNQDREANAQGREGAGENCREVCSSLRPNGLDSHY